MTNTAIIALLQEARVKIKGYASSDGLRLVEEAIEGLQSDQAASQEGKPSLAVRARGLWFAWSEFKDGSATLDDTKVIGFVDGLMEVVNDIVDEIYRLR